MKAKTLCSETTDLANLKDFSRRVALLATVFA